MHELDDITTQGIPYKHTFNKTDPKYRQVSILVLLREQYEEMAVEEG